MRFFRSANADLYESIRLQLDAAWGHPDEHTQTCIDPAAVAPRDSQGRIMLAVDSAFCEYAEVAAILPDLLASGAVEEITQAEYQAVLPIPLPTPIPEGDAFPVSPSNPRFRR